MYRKQTPSITDGLRHQFFCIYDLKHIHAVSVLTNDIRDHALILVIPFYLAGRWIIRAVCVHRRKALFPEVGHHRVNNLLVLRLVYTVWGLDMLLCAFETQFSG